MAPQPKVRLRQEVVSTAGQRRGQRIAMPVRKFFAREKRPYGLGMVGRLTNRTYRKRIDSYVKRQIEDMDDHRWAQRGCDVAGKAPGWGWGPQVGATTSADASAAGPSSPTGSPSCTRSSPFSPCASMASRLWASRSMRPWTR